MQADIAIIVVAFNRTNSLTRLLNSLREADYSSYQNIPLTISIDFSDSPECSKIAEAFNWEHGEKKIISYTENQGLKKHILQCGDLSANHDAVIVLEDDLFVSPAFYDFAQQAFTFYKENTNIAGIGLYNYKFNEFALCPFDPLSDRFDNYFLQVPCSWGQMWTKEQWEWFKEYISGHQKNSIVPREVELWPEATSWKKIFFNYMISSKRTFVYPRISLTTNFGDAGQHFNRNVVVWQTSLLMENKVFTFSNPEDSIAVYDAFFELDSNVFNKLNNTRLDVCFDLNGLKSLSDISNEYLISGRKCKFPIKKYALNLYPYEANILIGSDDHTIEENYFSFGKTKDFENELCAERRSTDIKRIFFYESSLTIAGRKEVFRTKEYRMGKFMMKPFRVVKKIFKIK